MTSPTVSGEFVDFAGERYYAIRHVDQMKPFFMSIVSNLDHWLFVSTTGGLTAGRVAPETALFPYVTVDKIHDNAGTTGPKTIVRVGHKVCWEPFNREHDGLYSLSRNLYKNTLGNKLCFEEINHDLQLTFRYTWATSDAFGFVRDSQLINDGNAEAHIDIVDGLQNLLPAGTPPFAQTNSSNLVDAYKWSELDEKTGLACLTLYSGITDRAEPSESLRATTVFSVGADIVARAISNKQLRAFRQGEAFTTETHTRGIRGAYFVRLQRALEAGTSRSWRIVSDVERSQADVVKLNQQLEDPSTLDDAITRSIALGCDDLERIMARSDGLQATAEENVSTHHYANVLFNVMRGGIFVDQYRIPSRDYADSVRHFSHATFNHHADFLAALPTPISLGELLAKVDAQDDEQLARLTYEYLPITFGRRHGDPSRPWNLFEIKVKNEEGEGVLSYQGNWRDIFQNWEALLWSYPGFIESVIAKFVNASTIDGYNPYRITKEGIDWEVEEPDNPWSYIGYWGDHQIIYLLKLLEQSRDFHPGALSALLRRDVFSYANVPYRIVSYGELMSDPKNTVRFDEGLEHLINERVTSMGADGKLLLDQEGAVYQVNLIEKLLVPLLAKIGNLVIDGGIWLTTQRPEWNDANNALVGHGLSMVTLYYMRRYALFLNDLLQSESQPFNLSSEVNDWLMDTSNALADVQPLLGNGPLDDNDRFSALTTLGEASGRYRERVYAEGFSRRVDCDSAEIQKMLDRAIACIDHSIGTNQRGDGLYNAYNLIGINEQSVSVDTLYPMLEGQVAALSAGALDAQQVIDILENLYASDIYRADQHSFMLYPDRALPGFLEKNRIDAKLVHDIPLLQSMLRAGDQRLVARDSNDVIRFNPDFRNVGDLNAALDNATANYPNEIDAARGPICALFEQVFKHKAFTGRSGTMFGFEGLGSIYWHMVSKLLLAVMENFYTNTANSAERQRLGELYYTIRDGIGFNKTPHEYGAFPTDPYSHTPSGSGARQPGMTGQVKEEVICRFAELGLRVEHGQVSIYPALLRRQEFCTTSQPFRYLDVHNQWQSIELEPGSLAFTWCQVPFVYTLDERGGSTGIRYTDDKQDRIDNLSLPPKAADSLFNRKGEIKRVDVRFSPALLHT
ncbi:MAG: hypothetical protein AAF465_02875 [Pseudomonadota bacterium]